MRHLAKAACLLLLLGGVPARAEVELGGALGTENYLGLRHGDFFDFRNANWLQLKLRADSGEAALLKANLELRNTNFTSVETAGQLWDRGRVEPLEWRLNEGYVTLYGLFFSSDVLTMDLQVGKQVLGWGEADGFNPSNPLDPYDLENPLDLKRRLGNLAVRASFTFFEEAAQLEAVMAPRFLPAVVPVTLFLGEDVLDSPFMPPLPAEARLLLEQLGLDLVPPTPAQILVDTPAFSGSEIMAGARLAFSALGIDWSLSYFRGRDNIPAVSSSQARIASGSAGGCSQEDHSCLVVEEVHLSYPRQQVIGANFRTDVWDIGLWGEAALVLPEQQQVSFTVPGLVEQQLPFIEEEPFVKWVLGGEYTFSGGWYVNLQWVHGFFTEQTGHALHDYLFLVLRQSWLNERLKVELTLGGELDHSRGQTQVAGMVMVEATYQPADAVQLTIGYAMARGQQHTTLSLFEPLDQLYGKLIMYF